MREDEPVFFELTDVNHKADQPQAFAMDRFQAACPHPQAEFEGIVFHVYVFGDGCRDGYLREDVRGDFSGHVIAVEIRVDGVCNEGDGRVGRSHDPNDFNVTPLGSYGSRRRKQRWEEWT